MVAWRAFGGHFFRGIDARGAGAKGDCALVATPRARRGEFARCARGCAVSFARRVGVSAGVADANRACTSNSGVWRRGGAAG